MELRTFKSDALRSVEAGTSGASHIGVPPIDGLSAQANNIETALQELAGIAAPPPPAASETTAGIVELASATETQDGTDTSRAVHPAGLKSELDRRLSSGAVGTFCELTRSADQSIADNAFAAVQWDTEVRDPLGWHSTTNPERVTPGVAGMYIVSFFSLFANNATGVRRARLLAQPANLRVAEDGTAPITGFTSGLQTVTSLVYLSATDYLVAEVFQNSGAALSLAALSRLTLARVV